MKPLLFEGEKLYCAKFDKICSTSDLGKTFQDEGKLDLQIPFKSLLGFSYLARRIMRAEVYRMRVLPNGNRVYVFRGGIYTQAAGEDSAKLSMKITRGSRPTSLCVSKEGHAVFGEYWKNQDRESVRVYASKDSGLSWQAVYEFAPGSIRHIHGIQYDEWDDCYWIATGDDGDEVQLIRASTDFSKIEIVRQGLQDYRFFSLTVSKEKLLLATDSPDDQNHIFLYDKKADRLETATTIENASFFSCQVGNHHFVSTITEPTEVNDETASYLWAGSQETDNWRRIVKFPVDRLYKLSRTPFVLNALFQYSTVFFPDGPNPSDQLVCYPIGVTPYSNALLFFDTKALMSEADKPG
ncbi:MAG: hypothetical protein AAF530_23015 [Pseudomonadota bacterium]